MVERSSDWTAAHRMVEAARGWFELESQRLRRLLDESVQSRQGKPLISLAALLPFRAQPLELQQRDRHHPKPGALIVKDGLGTSRFHEVQLRFLHPRRESFRTLGSPAARVRAAVDDLFRTTLRNSA